MLENNTSFNRALFNDVVEKSKDMTNEFSSINTEQNFKQFDSLLNLGQQEGTINSLLEKRDLFGGTRLAAFSEDKNKDYDDYILDYYYQEFPDSSALGGEDGTTHGVSRIPKGQYRGRYLKRMNHPTIGLAILSDLNYRNEANVNMPETLNGLDTQQLQNLERDLDGTSSPFKIYTTKEEGRDVLYSFPSSESVSRDRFTELDGEERERMVLSSYPLQDIKKYIEQHEIPGKVPNKKENKYYIYGDSGSNSYGTIGIGHLIDTRRPSSIESTRRKLNRINPSLTVEGVISGEQGLTFSEVQKLFEIDVKEKIVVAQRQFPKLHTYPKEMQAAIVDGYFWGMLGKSRKTRILLKSNRFEEAKKEWLDNKTFRTGESRYRFQNFNKAIDVWINSGRGGE